MTRFGAIPSGDSFEERVDDRVFSLLVEGTNVNFTYDDVSNTLTIDVSSLSTEEVQDIVGAMLTDSSTVDFTYDDGAGTLTAIVKDSSLGTGKLSFDVATQAELNAHAHPFSIQVQVLSDPSTGILGIGDGQAMFVVPSTMNGRDIASVFASNSTSSSSGTVTAQIRRVRSGTPVDVLSTALTIDATETNSSTAATPAVINTSNDDLATGDILFIDIDTSGTGVRGFVVIITTT